MFAKCLNCGARFRFIPSQTAGKYCSRECDYAARKVTSEVAEGIAWRQAMVRMGKHHSEQQVRLALSLRGAPREEIAVGMDDLMREHRAMKASIRKRYRNMTKERRRKMKALYKESLKMARRVYREGGKLRFGDD